MWLQHLGCGQDSIVGFGLAEGAMAAGQTWAVCAPAIVPSHFATGRPIVELYLFLLLFIGCWMGGPMVCRQQAQVRFVIMMLL
jgi:hypothetical protein